MNDSSKSAIVTGASRGIGAAIAERLAADGFAVVINFSGSEAAAKALAGKITGKGGRAVAVQADVSEPQAVKRLFDAAETNFGGTDVLVNNAGIMMLKAIGESDDALFDRQIAINLKGTFNGLREAARRLRQGGRIVNFSTSVVGLKLENYGVYAATKAAVETLTAILAKELRGRSISVNAIAPGPDRNRSLPERQAAGAGGAHGEDEPAGAAGHAGGHRRRRGLSRGAGRILDQRPDPARQWRRGVKGSVTATPFSPWGRRGRG